MWIYHVWEDANLPGWMDGWIYGSMHAYMDGWMESHAGCVTSTGAECWAAGSSSAQLLRAVQSLYCWSGNLPAGWSHWNLKHCKYAQFLHLWLYLEKRLFKKKKKKQQKKKAEVCCVVSWPSVSVNSEGKYSGCFLLHFIQISPKLSRIYLVFILIISFITLCLIANVSKLLRYAKLRWWTW